MAYNAMQMSSAELQIFAQGRLEKRELNCEPDRLGIIDFND